MAACPSAIAGNVWAGHVTNQSYLSSCRHLERQITVVYLRWAGNISFGHVNVELDKFNFYFSRFSYTAIIKKGGII